jgi:hypothetical protein
MQTRRSATFSHHAIAHIVKKRSHVLSTYMTSSSSTRRAFSASAAAKRPLTLPRLPVPDLHQTLSKYLRSLVPLLQEDEARGGPSWRSALQQRQQWADEFESGLGAQCQERLHGKSAKWPLSLDPSPLMCVKKLSIDPRPVTGWMIIYG